VAGDFVITNGAEFSTVRSTASIPRFRIDGGDKPEFLALSPRPRRHLRLGLKTTAGVKWLG